MVYTECGDGDASPSSSPSSHHHHHVIGPLRHGILGAAFGVTLLCGFFRALYPCSVSDLHVFVCIGAAIVLVTAPQSLDWQASPFARPLGLAGAATRVCRVGLFALCYSATTVAILPQRPFSVEPLVIGTRAFAATLWLLATAPLGLLGGPFYLAVLCMRRAHATPPPSSSAASGGLLHAYKAGGGGAGPRQKVVHAADDLDGERDDDVIIGGEPTDGTARTCNLSEDRKRDLMIRMGAIP